MIADFWEHSYAVSVCKILAASLRDVARERDEYKDAWHKETARNVKRDRTIAALKGQITKLKRKLEASNARTT